MKTAIIYASKHGTTKKVAELIRQKLGTGSSILISLNENPSPDLSSYDNTILGCSVYAGNPLKAMTRFCKTHSALLEEKVTGLFLCGMEPDPEKQKQLLQNAYPAALQSRAKASMMLGGEFLFEEMSWLERVIIKKIAKTTESISGINNKSIDLFVKQLAD